MTPLLSTPVSSAAAPAAVDRATKPPPLSPGQAMPVPNTAHSSEPRDRLWRERERIRERKSERERENERERERERENERERERK